MQFNIGITCIGYNCKEGLQRVLASWRSIKENPSLCPSIKSVKIAFIHGCFEETYELGYPIQSEDGTFEYALSEVNRSLDIAHFVNAPAKEYEMWTMGYEMTKSMGDIDLLWMLNTDEVWEIEEINNVIGFIQRNELVDFYKINFKNYCIDTSTWVDDFIVPRIWWANKQSGLKRFYKDDLVEYNNLRKDYECESSIIPRFIAFPKHYSWVGSDEYLKRKLLFQQKRYGICSYKWDHEKNKLCLNDEYYLLYNKTKPTLYQDYW